jgi:hypothetical protein
MSELSPVVSGRVGLDLARVIDEATLRARSLLRGIGRRTRAHVHAAPMSRSSRRRVAVMHRPTAVPPCLIDAIRAINPTVDPEFLMRFDESALRLYLAHLESCRVPRGRGARWERPGDTRAIRLSRPPEEA